MTTETASETATAHEHGAPRADRAPRLRASDTDRSATVEALSDAVALGLLDHQEGSQRMATALAARFVDELPALTADLPSSGSSTPPPAPAVGWRSLGWALVLQVRDEIGRTRAAGLRSRRFLVVVLLAVVLLGVLGLLGSSVLDGLAGGFDHHGSFVGH